MESGFYSILKAIYYIFMFSLILAAAYIVTKFLARKGMAPKKAKVMKLVESMPLGADKSLHLIKVGSQYFLIGSASKNMFKISEIEPDSFFEDRMESPAEFGNYDYDSFDDGIEDKDFGTYLGSVKQNLKKLKSMVRGNNSDEI